MRLRALLAVAAAALLALSGCAPGPSPDAHPKTTAFADARRAAGIPDCPETTGAAPVAGGLPDVTVECLGGTSSVRLPGLARKPTVVVMWAQWCDPCRQESPLLARVLPSYGDRLDVLLVDTNDPQTGLAVDFVRDAGLARWPVAVDPDWAVQSGTKTAHVLPVSYLVGTDGVIALTKLGVWSEDELRSALADKLGVVA